MQIEGQMEPTRERGKDTGKGKESLLQGHGNSPWERKESDCSTWGEEKAEFLGTQSPSK